MKKDFLKKEILKRLVLQTVDDVALDLGVSRYMVAFFEGTMLTGEPYGVELTRVDILELYLDGLTFREIGYLKGITKEGVRYLFNGLDINKEDIKRVHRKTRKEVWERVQGEKVRDLVLDKGIEGAAQRLGYSVRYLRRIYNRVEEGRK